MNEEKDYYNPLDFWRMNPWHGYFGINQIDLKIWRTVKWANLITTSVMIYPEMDMPTLLYHSGKVQRELEVSCLEYMDTPSVISNESATRQVHTCDDMHVLSPSKDI